jgi:hypothetical protein
MASEPTLERPAGSTPGRAVVPIYPAIQHHPPNRSRRVAVAPALAAVATVLLAACGSSSPTAATTTGSESAALAAARCMRAHGISNFPDPGPGGGMTVLNTTVSSSVTIDGIPFGGPAFQAAEKICKPLGDSGPGRPAVPEQQKRALLDFARCMRQHGIAYADPQFPAGGGIFGGGGSGQDNNSPAVKHAAAICNTAMRSGNAG